MTCGLGLLLRVRVGVGVRVGVRVRGFQHGFLRYQAPPPPGPVLPRGLEGHRAHVLRIATRPPFHNRFRKPSAIISLVFTYCMYTRCRCTRHCTRLLLRARVLSFVCSSPVGGLLLLLLYQILYGTANYTGTVPDTVPDIAAIPSPKIGHNI